MRPISEKNKRRDSKMRYKGYLYANKKDMRNAIARRARRLKIMSNEEYRKLGGYTVQDIW